MTDTPETLLQDALRLLNDARRFKSRGDKSLDSYDVAARISRYLRETTKAPPPDWGVPFP